MEIGPLRPFNSAEVLGISEAARIAGRTADTIREWAARYHIGRLVGGRWAISKVALHLFLENDHDALQAYLRGDRKHPRVAAAYEAEGVSLIRAASPSKAGVHHVV